MLESVEKDVKSRLIGKDRYHVKALEEARETAEEELEMVRREGKEMKRMKVEWAKAMGRLKVEHRRDLAEAKLSARLRIPILSPQLYNFGNDVHTAFLEKLRFQPRNLETI